MSPIIIKPFTKDIIANGIGRFVPCYMYGVNDRKISCNMWLDIFNEIGQIGFIPYINNEAVGQIIFLPKKYARKITIPFSKELKHFEQTLVIGCLVVKGEQFNASHWNKGVASKLIEHVIGFAKENGYKRIEAAVDIRSPKEAQWMVSSFPFLKFGFKIEENSFGWEGKENMKMCSLDIMNGFSR